MWFSGIPGRKKPRAWQTLLMLSTWHVSCAVVISNLWTLFPVCSGLNETGRVLLPQCNQGLEALNKIITLSL